MARGHNEVTLEKESGRNRQREQEFEFKSYHKKIVVIENSNIFECEFY